MGGGAAVKGAATAEVEDFKGGGESGKERGVLLDDVPLSE